MGRVFFFNRVNAFKKKQFLSCVVLPWSNWFIWIWMVTCCAWFPSLPPEKIAAIGEIPTVQWELYSAGWVLLPPPPVRGSYKVVFKKTNRFLDTQNFREVCEGSQKFLVVLNLLGKMYPTPVKRGAKVPSVNFHGSQRTLVGEFCVLRRWDVASAPPKHPHENSIEPPGIVPL